MLDDKEKLDEIEKKLNLIAQSQEVICDDKLAKLIEECVEVELDEDELELVTGATKPDYQKFLDYVKLREKFIC